MNKISKAVEIIIRRLNLIGFVESNELNFKLSQGLSPIIIYQMGKVGSTTIYNSLKESRISNPVFHLHFLTDEGHKASVLDYKRTRPGKPFYDHIRHSHIVRSKLRNKDIKWKIITLVRDPIAREISDYFQTLERRSPESLDENGKLKDLKATIETIRETLTNFNESSDFACTWFDRELKAVFGIDIYAYPFDRDKGYTIINSERADVLTIRLEDLARSKQILTEFLAARNPIEIVNKNVGSKKPYASQYKTVKKQIVVPRNVCERIYASRLARHFYQDDMIAKFINKWSRSSIGVTH